MRHFRAAAVEQLTEWATRSRADIIKPRDNEKSPSSVLYSALDRALKENYDYLIVDTSGRLHSNVNLMGELKKMFRVVQKFRPEGPDETLLVVDATIGRNAVTQAKNVERRGGGDWFGGHEIRRNCARRFCRFGRGRVGHPGETHWGWRRRGRFTRFRRRTFR